MVAGGAARIIVRGIIIYIIHRYTSLYQNSPQTWPRVRCNSLQDIWAKPQDHHQHSLQPRDGGAMEVDVRQGGFWVAEGILSSLSICLQSFSYLIIYISVDTLFFPSVLFALFTVQILGIHSNSARIYQVIMSSSCGDVLILKKIQRLRLRVWGKFVIKVTEGTLQLLTSRCSVPSKSLLGQHLSHSWRAQTCLWHHSHPYLNLIP